MPPIWALSNGLPTAHLVRAALRAAQLVDATGSPIPVARGAYRVYPSDALYPPEDLRIGERLLLDCGLLMQRDDYLYPTEQIAELIALDEDAAVACLFAEAAVEGTRGTRDVDGDQLGVAVDQVSEGLKLGPDQRDALLLALGRRFDDVKRRELGSRGEDLVVAMARDELDALSRHDLALRVRRVSTISDQLGYDVIAPKVSGTRHLEVKTAGRANPGLFRFFLSRNEHAVGAWDQAWALVACETAGIDDLRLLGWCRASVIEPYLPVDSVGGSWTGAEVELPITSLEPGLPPTA